MSRLERLYSPPEIGAPGKRRARSRRADLLMAGLFVLAMAGVVLALLLLLSPGLLTGYRLSAYFLDAAGLDGGIDVMQEGFVIGHVRTVTPVFVGDPDRGACPPPDSPRAPELPCFRAELQIEHEWPVPPDSRAQLGPGGLMKGNVIRIHPSVEPGRLADGARIDTLPRQPDIAAQIAQTLEQAQQTIDSTIRPTLEEIQARIQALLGGPAADGEGPADGAPKTPPGEGLAEVFASLRQLSRDVEQIVDPERIGAILGAVEELTANLATVSGTFTERSTDVQQAVQSYTALAGDLRELVDETQPTLAASLDDTQYLLQELAAALTPILANIETASRNLAALSGDLRQDPKSLLFRSQQKEPSPWFER